MFYIKLEFNSELFPLDLPENFEFSTTFENKMFEMDSFDILYSTPFDFPSTTKNSKLLDFPANLKNQKNAFVDREAFLYQNETLLEKGILRTQNYGNGNYQGSFRGQISNLEKYKDSTLQSILGNLMYDFGRYYTQENFENNESPTEYFYKVVVEPANGTSDKKTPICFPYVKINQILYNAYDFQTKTFIPFFRLHYILKAVFNKIGYEFLDTYSEFCPDFDRLILANQQLLATTNQASEQSFELLAGEYGDYQTNFTITSDFAIIDRYLKIADNIPAMKFKDFLESIQKLLGIDFEFNHIYQTVKMNFFRDIFANTEQKDWTSKAEPCQNIEGNDYEGYIFSFKKDGADTEQKDLLETLPSKVAEIVRKSNEIVANTPTKNGNLYFSTLEKKYYQIQQLFFGLNAERKAVLRFESIFVADEFFDFKKDAAGKTIETQFQPIALSNWIEIEAQKIKIEKNTYGNWLNSPLIFFANNLGKFAIRTNTMIDNAPLANFPRNQMYVYLKNSQMFQKNIWIEVQYMNPPQPATQDRYLFFLNYPMNINSPSDVYGEVLDGDFFEENDLIFKSKLPFSVPSFSAKLGENQRNVKAKPIYLAVVDMEQDIYHLNEQAINAETTENANRILLFHSLQIVQYSDFNESGFEQVRQKLIPYASPDNTAPNGAKISEFALRWNKSDNLIDTFWKDFLKFQKNKKVAEYTLRLHPNDLQNFRKTDKIRIDDVLFFVKKMEKTYDKTGLKKTVCTLESIANGVCEHNVSLDIYETAEVKQVLISKTIFENP